jgi:PIN domain nuclease of toxin-antitoxin system
MVAGVGIVPKPAPPATQTITVNPRPDRRVLAERRYGGSILISAAAVWETAQLVDTGRISLDRPVEAWLERFTARPGLAAMPLTASAAAGAYRLHHLEHRDPADRLMIATAIELSCPLVTYDARIVRFAEAHGGRYGFSTLA